MFRALLLRSAFRAVPRRIGLAPIPTRSFHQSIVSLKKKSSKKGAVEEEVDDEVPEIDFDELSSRFQSVIDKFAKQANEAKLGKTSPQLFDHLTVHTSDGEVQFTSVAQTAVKGRNFMITVFDPANSKHIINAVLSSDLNMNAILDPSNKQTLKVPLPPVTTESKKENAKQLKAIFEKLRNGPGGSGKHAHTLAAIRADVKHKVSKKKKLSDGETVIWNKVEKLHKLFVDKLTDVFKAAELAILK